MRLGFSTQEAYFTILGVLIGSCHWYDYRQLAGLPRPRKRNSTQHLALLTPVRASWPLLIVFAIAFCPGEAALLILAFASFFALRELR